MLHRCLMRLATRTQKQFTCFTGTKVQILTSEALRAPPDVSHAPVPAEAKDAYAADEAVRRTAKLHVELDRKVASHERGYQPP
jgi:hypothetical protein